MKQAQITRSVYTTFCSRKGKKQTGDIAGSLNTFRTLIIDISALLGCDVTELLCNWET